MIAVVDTGVGAAVNLARALQRAAPKTPVRVTQDPEVLARADRIALPGQGNFGEALQSIADLVQPLRQAIQTGKPFLGVCLGLHLLYADSQESPGASGLGCLPGRVVRLRSATLPHVGWSFVTGDLPGWYYFCHSYVAAPAHDATVAATCEAGGHIFPALVKSGSMWAAQYHPEKSGVKGLEMLRAWLREGGP